MPPPAPPPTLGAYRQWLSTELDTSPYEQLVWLSMEGSLLDGAYRTLFQPTPDHILARIQAIDAAIAIGPRLPPPGLITIPELNQWRGVRLANCLLTDLVWLQARAEMYTTAWPVTVPQPDWLPRRVTEIAQALSVRLPQERPAP